MIELRDVQEVYDRNRPPPDRWMGPYCRCIKCGAETADHNGPHHPSCPMLKPLPMPPSFR